MVRKREEESEEKVKGEGEGWKRERKGNAAGNKAQTKQRRKVKQANLEVFCSSWSGRDGYLLALEECVDSGALANIRVANLEQDYTQ